MSSAPYIPTSFTPPASQTDGDTAFWKTLIEHGPGYVPSGVFPRFTDALFFYLDENVEPKNSGYIEPNKISHWVKAVRGLAISPDTYESYNRFAFEVWEIPTRIVTARRGDPQGGKEIAILDRYGFMLYMLANVRADPDTTSKGFRASISLFKLVDPLTRLPFPPMPRSALPIAVDSEAARLEAIVLKKSNAKAEETLAAARAYAEITARGRAAALSLIGPSEYRIIG